MLTKESDHLIDHIKKKIKHKGLKKPVRKLFNFFEKIDYNVKIISVQDTLSSNVTLDSPFISENIKKAIMNLKSSKTIVFTTNKSTITMNVYYTDEDLKDFLNNIIHAICFVFNLSTHNVRNFTINYYLSDFQKMIDINNNYNINEFTTDEVNSGSCSNDTINIWRKEEVLKVTLHECIHLLDYDHKNEDEIIKQYYKAKYNIISSSMNIFEAYTEIWAVLINLYLISRKQKNKKTTFAKYIEYEKYLSNYQAHKIFFLKNLGDKGCDLNKHTNILPYYIVKCEIINNLEKFLDYCQKNNANYIKLKYDFSDFLIKNMTKCKRNNRLFTKINKNSYLFKTMRMSSIELELFKHSQE